MTIREVGWRIAEEQKRENRALERNGQLAVWLINSQRKKKDQIKLSDLVKWRFTRRTAE